MLGRLVLALILVGAGLLLGGTVLRLGLERRAHHGLMIPDYRWGRPAILYFTAPGCLPCEAVQRPALRDLSQAFGERLQIFEIDATLQPRLADAWGVLSVPTTFLIDAHGRPRRVNHGPTRAGPLADQLASLGESPRRPLQTAPSEG